MNRCVGSTTKRAGMPLPAAGHPTVRRGGVVMRAGQRARWGGAAFVLGVVIFLLSRFGHLVGVPEAGLWLLIPAGLALWVLGLTVFRAHDGPRPLRAPRARHRQGRAAPDPWRHRAADPGSSGLAVASRRPPGHTPCGGHRLHPRDRRHVRAGGRGDPVRPRRRAGRGCCRACVPRRLPPAWSGWRG